MSLPTENLDNKTFEEFVKEAISRIPVYAPDWTDHNIHDPGITFIELFAWLAEMQIYSLNKIPDRNYRKFLKLMGIPRLRPVRPAEVDVTFTLLGKDPVDVPCGTLVAARDPLSGEDVLFETKKDLKVVDTQITKILSCTQGGEFLDRSDVNESENVYYYAFSSQPEKGDGLYIGFTRSLTGKEIMLAFYLFEEDRSPDTKEKIELFSHVKLNWEYCTGGDWENNDNWESIEEIKDETRSLTVSGNIRIKVQKDMVPTQIEDDQKLFWIRCQVEDARYDIVPKMDCVLLNTVSAVQRSGLKVKKKSSSGLPDITIDLKEAHILDDKILKVEVKDDPWGEFEKWSKVEDFDASIPGNKHYTVDPEAGKVTFGDGLQGKIPPEGEDNILVSYRTGSGVRGNVKSHTITTVIGEYAKKVAVDNKNAAQGGEEAETLEKTIQCARSDLKKTYRAVTTEDYEHLVKNVPGVAKAKAIPGYHPSQDSDVPGVVSIIVVPESLNVDSAGSPEEMNTFYSGFIKTVYSYLEKKRLLATELFVLLPEYEDVIVRATVVIQPRYILTTVQDNVRNRLKDFLDPAGWLFGRSVYLSEIYEIIDGADGVDYVTDVTINDERKDKKIPAHYLVYSGDHDISAVDPSTR